MSPLLEKEGRKWLCAVEVPGGEEPSDRKKREDERSTVHTITVPPRCGQRLHHPHDRHFIPEEERSVKGK